MSIKGVLYWFSPFSLIDHPILHKWLLTLIYKLVVYISVSHMTGHSFGFCRKSLFIVDLASLDSSATRQRRSEPTCPHGSMAVWQTKAQIALISLELFLLKSVKMITIYSHNIIGIEFSNLRGSRELNTQSSHSFLHFVDEE